MAVARAKRIVLGLGAILLVFALLTAAYVKILQLGSGTLRVLLENWVLSAVALYLIVFLAMLVVRYAILLLYSFMEHIEYSLHGRKQLPATDRQDRQLPMISLVVPAYNEGLVIQPAIRSLLELDYPNYEILVVNDGSSDDTYEKALAVARESTHVPVRVINKRNGGKADALNTGMAHARGEFILNMDGDTKLSSNALRACIGHFDNPRIGAVAGNVKVLNRDTLWAKIQSVEYIEGLALARKAQSYLRSVIIIPGPLGMFRKSVLQQAGGYDHDTFAEDCDLTLKLLMRGWQIAYEPAAIAWVETPSRLLDLLKQRYRWTRGILQAIRKHASALWRPRKAGVNFFILWYMLFEGILWPFSTVLGSLFFAYVGLYYGVAVFIFFWWLQLTLLDVIAAAYCVIIEEEDPALIGYSIYFRLFYIVIVDVAKVFATIEEWRGKSMTWGKLQREGKL